MHDGMSGRPKRLAVAPVSLRTVPRFDISAVQHAVEKALRRCRLHNCNHLIAIQHIEAIIIIDNSSTLFHLDPCSIIPVATIMLAATSLGGIQPVASGPGVPAALALGGGLAGLGHAAGEDRLALAGPLARGGGGGFVVVGCGGFASAGVRSGIVLEMKWRRQSFQRGDTLTRKPRPSPRFSSRPSYRRRCPCVLWRAPHRLLAARDLRPPPCAGGG